MTNVFFICFYIVLALSFIVLITAIVFDIVNFCCLKGSYEYCILDQINPWKFVLGIILLLLGCRINENTFRDPVQPPIGREPQLSDDDLDDEEEDELDGDDANKPDAVEN